MDKIFDIAGFISLSWVLVQWAEIVAEKKPNLIRFICWKCWAFWFTLLYTFDPFTASITALTAYLIDRKL